MKHSSWVVSSVADAVAVNPNGIKTLLAKGLSIFPIKGISVFSNCLKSLPKNPPPNCYILRDWVFDDFILADESFAKALQSFEACALVNNIYSEYH